MARGRRPGTKIDRMKTNRCEWCGEAFECARIDKATCDASCRSALARHVREWGYKPDTAQPKPPRRAKW